MQTDLRGMTDLAAEPACALRILSRRDDSQVLIVHGEDRAVGEGERLAWIGWLASAAMAERMARYCTFLLTTSHMPPDEAGWHAFDVRHLRNLLSAARNRLNVSFQTPAAAPTARQAWTGERIARLGFLAGLGWTAKRIAADPLIRSTPNNVYRQAHRFGIALSDGPQGENRVRLPAEIQAVYDKAAERAQLRTDLFLRRVLIAKAPEIAGLATAA